PRHAAVKFARVPAPLGFRTRLIPGRPSDDPVMTHDDVALEQLMLFRQFKSISQAFYALFADSGFAMAGAVAYSFVLSFFPFCVFLGALAGYFGGEPLAREAIARLFELVPEPV